MGNYNFVRKILCHGVGYLPEVAESSILGNQHVFSIFEVSDKNHGTDYLYTLDGKVVMKMTCRGNLKFNMDSINHS
jgi:hypothetical protein